MNHYYRLFPARKPVEATFEGGQFLSFNLSQMGGADISSSRDQVSLQFKTKVKDALLFHASEYQHIIH